MAGVTVQQLLRRKTGVLVRHVRCVSGYVSQVIVNGKIVSETPDDCLASGSYYQTEKIWNAFYHGKIVYQMQPAFSYLANHDVLGALDGWSRSQFESELLPTLEEIPSLSQQVECYKEHANSVDEYDRYVLYDVLVRLYLYCRYHNINIVRSGVEGLEVTTCDQALLPGVEPQCIDLDHAFGAAVEVLYISRGGYSKVTIGDKNYLVTTCAVHALQSAGCGEYIEPQPCEIAKWLAGGADLPEVGGVIEGGEHLDPEFKKRTVELVYQILAKGGVAITSDEKDLAGFVQLCVERKNIGRNALNGLGKILGEGPLQERLEHVFKEVRLRARDLPLEGVYRLAASKVSGMHSAKVVKRTNGVAAVEDRKRSDQCSPAVSG